MALRSRHHPLVFTATLVVTLLLLVLEGRSWWCACGSVALWSSDIWSAHCSQHWIDPYSFTHFSHGLLFCLALAVLLPRLDFVWQLWIGMLIECAWEVLENSPLIIERYRVATISLGYEGDSILNAISDIACCVFGFCVARWLGLRRTVVLFVLIELILLVTIRDNLTLNVLMLAWPIEAIKVWQSVQG